MYVRVCAKVYVKHLTAKEGVNKGDSGVMNEFAWLAVCMCAHVCMRMCMCLCVFIYFA